MATVTEALPRTYAQPYAGLWSWITTVDHKRIGILYGSTAFIFFLIGGIEALLIRTQLIVPDNHFVTGNQFNALFTMHGTTMIFLAIMPFSAAFFNFMVPLQIGARDVAFPRLNAFSYWVFLAGGVLLHLSFLFGSPPDAGWFGYANLTHLMSRTSFAGAIFKITPDNLKKWVSDPPAMKPMRPEQGTGMPDLGLSDREVDQVVAYLETLK